MARTLAARFIHWSQSWPVFIGMSIWLVLWSALHLVPASWWMHVRYIQVKDTQAGRAVEMIVDREIRHEFYGQWSVHLRKKRDGGWETIDCGDGSNTYRTTSIFPAPLTLEWWSDGACSVLPPGTYQISTQWQIYPGGLWPPKQISVLSNVFHVQPGAVVQRQD